MFLPPVAIGSVGSAPGSRVILPRTVTGILFVAAVGGSKRTNPTSHAQPRPSDKDNLFSLLDESSQLPQGRRSPTASSLARRRHEFISHYFLVLVSASSARRYAAALDPLTSGRRRVIVWPVAWTGCCEAHGDDEGFNYQILSESHA